MCQGVPLGKQMELVGVFCVEDLAGVASCWLSFNKDSSPPPPPPKTDTHQQKEKQMGKGRMRETKEMFHKFASLKPGRDTNNSYLVYTHSHSCHGTPYTQTFCTNNSQILSWLEQCFFLTTSRFSVSANDSLGLINVEERYFECGSLIHSFLRWLAIIAVCF